jgi:hypothetical protein
MYGMAVNDVVDSKNSVSQEDAVQCKIKIAQGVLITFAFIIMSYIRGSTGSLGLFYSNTLFCASESQFVLGICLPSYLLGYYNYSFPNSIVVVKCR